MVTQSLAQRSHFLTMTGTNGEPVKDNPLREWSAKIFDLLIVV
jgi:hypothetical protein